MFKWYLKATVCFAFLEDWDPEEPAFYGVRWWTRGWTLRELVATESIIFYGKTWRIRGDKSSLCTEISRISRIDKHVLQQQEELSTLPVAVRMSWASNRKTTREEDIAYSLMGIFDINMPMLYGEGPKAFLRLQEEIIKATSDMSLFAWAAAPDCEQEYMGILAPSSREFMNTSRLYPSWHYGSLQPSISITIANQDVACN